MCATVTGDAQGTQRKARFDVWTTEHGLPQNSVNAIVQTRDGYLWLATMDGLARFDGVRFTVFSKANTAGIKSNRMIALCEDGDAVLWIGTEDGGVIRYKDRAFTTYTTADGLPADQVRAIRFVRGHLLLVHTERGVVRWSGSRFVPHTPDDASFSRFDSGGANIDDEGGIWAADSHGFYRWTSDAGMTFFGVRDIPPASVPVRTTYRDRRGAIWLGAAEAGVFTLRDGALVRPGHDLDHSYVNAFYEDRDGRMWIATTKGLVQYADGIVTTYTTAQGLSADNVLSVDQDSEGTLWIGTAQGGLNAMRNRVITMLSTEEGLSSNNVYPIMADRDGAVWIGAWPGLNRYKDGTVTPIVLANGSGVERPSALLQDSSGDVWVGTYGGGALRLHGNGPPFAAEAILPEGVVVHAILQDSTGVVWFGTAGGLVKYDHGRSTIYTTRDGLPHNRVTAIRETRDHVLWCGTRAGLARFSNGRFTSYGEASGLSGEHVRTIHEDADGVLWVGSYDGGLTRIKGGVFTRYTTKDGLFDYGVFQILEDDRGDFWISCNRGIYRVSRRELNEFAAGHVRSITSVAYGKRDGLSTVECNGGNQPAGVRTRDGRLWFPTQRGVAVVDPNEVKTARQPPSVLLEHVVINNEPSAIRDLVRMVPGQEILEIQYTGISFTSPEQVRFKYMLEGLDHEWTEVGTRRTAYYSHLPPGEYTFRVLAANRDGIWNTEGASVTIMVVPPFWRTGWFLGIELLLAAGIVALIYNRRVSRLQKAHAAQEAFSRELIASQERERGRIAAELHDSLGQNLLIIKNRAFMLRSKIADPAAALAQLAEISATAALAIDEVREIARNLRPFQLDRLGLTLALKDIFQKISDTSGIAFTTDIDELDGLLPPEAEINLYRIVQEGVNNMVKHSGATRAHVELKRNALRLLVRLADNGRGFAVDAADGLSGGGFGLASIRERARILGGTCTTQSAPGRGTIIQLSVNLPEPGDPYERNRTESTGDDRGRSPDLPKRSA